MNARVRDGLLIFTSTVAVVAVVWAVWPKPTVTEQFVAEIRQRADNSNQHYVSEEQVEHDKFVSGKMTLSQVNAYRDSPEYRSWNSSHPSTPEVPNPGSDDYNSWLKNQTTFHKGDSFLRSGDNNN